jgi:Phytanoyl-CoA dioxygenase (PhyH)
MRPSVATATTVDQAVEVLERDGVVILPGLLSAARLDALRNDAAVILETTPVGKDDFFAGTKTKRRAALFARTRALDCVVTNPLFLETSRRLLCTPMAAWYGDQRVDETPTVQISVTQFIQILPGQGLQPLHRDDVIFHNVHPGPDAEVSIMVAVTDFTEENGATRVIPGSNHWDDRLRPRVEDTVPAEMAAGSAALWLGSTYHGGGQNRTRDDVRIGAGVGIAKGFLRQEENQYLAIPRETVLTLPKELQGLLGYAPSAPFMGWLEYDGEMADPAVALGQTDNAGLRTGHV